MLLPLFITVLLTIPLGAIAQFSYVIDQSIPVEDGGEKLSMPWSGGINSAQINTMDINGDGKSDLVVFDRSANKALTFLDHNSEYKYSPEYEILLPEVMRHWVLLRDFNCDGKKDLFTSDPFGAVVFVNTTKTGEMLSWRPFNSGRPLLTKGFTPNINLKINESDIPAIDDIDGDGDLDILNMKPSGFSIVEWHKNMDLERDNVCDSLQFERILPPQEAWGNFEECTCAQFGFHGVGCSQRIVSRVNHSGGKALLTLDVDNDKDKDLIFSEEYCPNVFMLTNTGDRHTASITRSALFPPYNPVFITSFPASFLEDVDFDGKPDLIVSPNVYIRGTESTMSFQQSVWLYKNTGTSLQPNFTFMKDDFLQDEMIDVGEYAYPAFTDYDGDGDQDMFIGIGGAYGNFNFKATLFQYENIGTISKPSFRLVTNDFVDLSQYNLRTLKPQFADINGDGNVDLIFMSTMVADRRLVSRLMFMPGTKPNKVDVLSEFPESVNFPLRFDENVLIVDVNMDGAMDILVGRGSGSLGYYINEGVPGIPNYILDNAEFMGMGYKQHRRAVGMDVGDLDGDGKEDLIFGYNNGHIAIYKDFRSTHNVDEDENEGISKIIYNPLKEVRISKNLGGRITPVVVNLFNHSIPSIAVGTVTGGVLILKPNAGELLADEPIIKIYPNPALTSENISIESTQDAFVQFFTIGGKKLLLKPIFLVADRPYPFASEPISLSNVAAGVYIARLTIHRKTYSHYFIVQ